MMNLPSRSRRILVVLSLILGGGGIAAFIFWPRSTPLPQPGSPTYDQYLRAFQVGVAAEDTVVMHLLAREKLDRAIELIPEEPAAWANRGLLNLRQSDVKHAAVDLRRAGALAPESGEVQALLGLLAERQGRLPDAVAHLRKAVETDPHNVALLFALADAVSKENKADSDAEYQRLMEEILKIQPNNLKVLVERARTAFKRKDMAAFKDTLTWLDRLASNWQPRTREALDAVHQAAAKTPQDVIIRVQFLGNFLQGERGFSLDARAVQPKPEAVGTPVHHFLRLKPVRPTPAPPDRELAFTLKAWLPPRPIPGLEKSKWDVVNAVWLMGEQQRAKLIDEANTNFGGLRVRPADTVKLAIILAQAREMHLVGPGVQTLLFPSGSKLVAPSAAGVLALDLNNDLRTTFVLAGAGGLRFFQQQAGGKLHDVTKQTKLPADVLQGDYYGVWAADIDLDGDLDLIVARRSGATLVLRNNRDGSFKTLETFASVKDARAFVWADLDNDGAADAVFLDAEGNLHAFANERAGQFSPWPFPKSLGTVLALTVADVNDDGVFDIVVLGSDGKLQRVSDQDQRKSWQVSELARWPGSKEAAPAAVTLHAADLDNNGAVDLVVAGPREAHVFLADEQGRFEILSAPIPLRVLAVVDLDQDGRLDFLGLSPEGRPMQALNGGKKPYHFRVLWPIANVKAEGDNRINSRGIGGEVEVRSGLVVQKQPITSPVAHFGLGEQSDVDVARIVWPNGLAQLEFELPKDRYLAAEQRLSGSCPFLFTHDGTGMKFAGDFMWGTPLGMYVNGQNTGDFPQTTEWLKIRGEQLVPRDLTTDYGPLGYYDVRVHANLWEADYFDQLALIVVDHPADTEIHVDERFFLTPTPPQLHVTTPARPVARAWDHHGQDATDLVRAIDGRYLDRCGRGRFQGITRDHWVEADLGDDAPKDGPLYLIARGWLHPTNSSINVAITQGRHPAPEPLTLEVPDGKGGWKVGRPALGFPAGKNKTMLIRLDGIDGTGVSRRFRLRTNMEIFWDFLGYARGLDAKLARLERPPPITAELRYCGILQMTQKGASSPEVPHYDKVSRGIQPWRDLTGYYTRFGDVRELLAKVDDRYVIANAGDEIALRFPVPDGPAAGWKRDFIWECDGWTKDGDLNTRHGNAVLPLPAHGVKMSHRVPAWLEEDPVYRRFPEDWKTYHTRYVTDEEFARGLRSYRRR
jgi:tetratricopeptide (TPR) repeat protein